MARALVWKLLAIGAPEEAVKGEESPRYETMAAGAAIGAEPSADSTRDANWLAKGRTKERELWDPCSERGGEKEVMLQGTLSKRFYDMVEKIFSL